ncbi:zinc-binding dehydrogenase [Streptomyces sp. NPDC101181]|uniref:zinc-binding dehydrogenase n=1 Tax=Streptomyces sp. NPDC101181 TaxID=3366125 RepID=UPI0037FB36B7
MLVVWVTWDSFRPGHTPGRVAGGTWFARIGPWEDALGGGGRGRIFGVRTDGAMLDTLARHVESGRLPLRIAHTLPFQEGPRAHALLEKGGTRGKILLTPGG